MSLIFASPVVGTRFRKVAVVDITWICRDPHPFLAVLSCEREMMAFPSFLIMESYLRVLLYITHLSLSSSGLTSIARQNRCLSQAT